MIARLLPANATLTERFGHLLYWLFEGMYLDWRRRGLRHVHNGEITLRVMGLWKRFRSVVARWEAGTLRPVVSRQGAVVSEKSIPPQGGREIGTAEAGAKRAKPAWSVLPRTFGWLKSLVLPDRQYCVTAFNWLLLDDADMKAIIAAAPVQIGRVLRPFCHLLGLEVPAELRLPKRRRGPGLRRHPAAASRLQAENGKRRRRTPREVAEDAIRESERTGKPINPGKIGAVAFGYTLHWPRDGNCPPPEIGYGGRRRRPPKDYRPPKDWE
jgi:hypothetical protein